MRGGVGLADVVDVVRADRLQVVFFGEGKKARDDVALFADAVVLEFDEVVFASEDIDIAGAGGVGLGLATVHEVLADLGGEAAGEADQALGVFGDGFEIGARLVVEALEVGVGDQFEQILVAGEVFGQDAEVKVAFAVLGFAGFFEARSRGHVELAADEGLEVGGLGGVEKLDGAEHVAMVGERDGGLAQLDGAFHQAVDFAGAVEQAVVGVDVEVDEIRGGDRHDAGKARAGGGPRKRGSAGTCDGAKKPLTGGGAAGWLSSFPNSRPSFSSCPSRSKSAKTSRLTAPFAG